MSDHSNNSSRISRNWPSVVGTPEQRASKGLSRLEDITRLISEWVWEADADGCLTYASERVTELLGWIPIQLYGQTFFEFGRFVNEDGAEITPNLENPFRELQFEAKCRSGDVRLLQVSGLPFYDRETGSFEGYCGTAEDITDRKQAEKALAESNGRFLAMLEESPIGVGVSRLKDGHIEYVNRRLAEIYGSTVKELMSITGADFWFDPADRDEFVRSFNANGHVSGASKKLKRVDGSAFWSILTWEKAETFGEGRILFWVYDISDLKSVELELLTAKQAADKSNQAKSEFLSSMSHELRTPLNGILGFAQLLDYDPSNPLSAKQKDNTSQIMKSGYHLLELIDQVLELAQIEAGKVTMSIEDVELRELMNECTPLISAMADKRGITLDSGCAGCEGIFVRADRTRLKQVILNLLSNAVKYNREEGSISVSVCAGDGDMIRVAISDTGPGIPEDKQEDLFKPFERLGLESSEIEGTGIGLTITRDLVHLMGGDIGFESEVGTGSTFWIEVPRSVAAEQEIPERDDTADETCLGTPIGDATKSFDVLYVEDNPANLALMQHIFESVPNLALISTHTAELGIEMAAAQRPALILMDINLPGMNGIEAMECLKNHEETSHIPVIAISAAAMPHQVKKGKEAGFYAYLTKPLQFDKLFDAMNGALKAE